MTVAAAGTCGRDDHSGTINLTVGDVENAAATLRLSAATSNSALVPTSNIVFAGGAAARTVTVRTVSGRTGFAFVTITVSDGQSTSTLLLAVRAGGNGGDTVTGDGRVDLIMGQGGNDTLSGADGNDLLCGGDGKDFLSGGAGDDTLIGAGQDDRLTGGPGADRFSGGPGNDKTTDYTAAEGDTTDGTIP